MWFYLWICCTWQYLISFSQFSKSIIICLSTCIWWRLCWKAVTASHSRITFDDSFPSSPPIQPLQPSINIFFIPNSLFDNANKMLQSAIIIIVIHSRLLFHHQNNKNLWRHTSVAAVPSSTPEQVLLTKNFIKMNLFFGRSISISLLYRAQQRNYLFLVLCCFGQKQNESSADIFIIYLFSCRRFWLAVAVAFEFELTGLCTSVGR